MCHAGLLQAVVPWSRIGSPCGVLHAAVFACGCSCWLVAAVAAATWARLDAHVFALLGAV
jgi:hypothetical protein